jgi:hypothetical protein
MDWSARALRVRTKSPINSEHISSNFYPQVEEPYNLSPPRAQEIHRRSPRLKPRRRRTTR